ncbi:hypothetical protein Cme02nite_66140 [Catellatospora methionotrophica]|uniref:Uncharacterized protein n=1 Tax=Catellatospora methionotrophica TaxID=121620 RepID=A0A8J3LCA9_9ACTN|nr:hypothetical protein Cme02nite_66140 [Catellatospora methionotrophica]
MLARCTSTKPPDNACRQRMMSSWYDNVPNTGELAITEEGRTKARQRLDRHAASRAARADQQDA